MSVLTDSSSVELGVLLLYAHSIIRLLLLGVGPRRFIDQARHHFENHRSIIRHVLKGIWLALLNNHFVVIEPIAVSSERVTQLHT